MHKKWKKVVGILCGFCFTFVAGMGAQRVLADQPITLWLNGEQIQTDVAPVIINDRTMVPIRAISEGLNLNVDWDAENRQVLITERVEAETNPAEVETPTTEVPVMNPVNDNSEMDAFLDVSIGQPIQGESVATAEQLQQLAWANNPDAPDVAQLYLDIGKIYGIRGDIAFCQAAKETGWWKYGNLVQAYQNNYCGLGATGSPATGEESLYGADRSRVWYVEGVHGAIFATPADGVEAQIQHLYAYCCTDPLPEGRDIVDPRFTLVTRGIAPNWQDLNGRWAVPGVGYGESIIQDYYAKVFDSSI